MTDAVSSVLRLMEEVSEQLHAYVQTNAFTELDERIRIDDFDITIRRHLEAEGHPQLIELVFNAVLSPAWTDAD